MEYSGSKGSEFSRMVEWLKEKKFSIASSRALDMFARDGTFRTVDYANYVGTLTAWEINQKLADRFKENFPFAEVEGGVNSIVRIRREARDGGKFWDLIVADHPGGMFGGYCEHFDFLEYATKCLSPDNETALVFGVREYPLNNNPEALARRKKFYGVNAVYLNLSFLEGFYDSYFGERGLLVKDSTFIRQSNGVYWYAVYIFERGRNFE